MLGAPTGSADMAAGFLQQKLGRAREAAALMTSYTRDLESRATLASCYAAILRDPMDITEVELSLFVGGRTYPIRMRRCDVFTVAEMFYERQYALQSTVTSGGVIVDAGANIGLASIYFYAQYPGSRIFAFEPAPTNFRYLEHNVAHLDGVTVENVALGAEDGQTTLHFARHNAVHSTVHTADATGVTATVDVLALGPYLDRQGVDRIELLKLDVEGAEMMVLDGLGDRLDKVQVAVGECHEREVDPDAFYGRLREHGLQLVQKQYFGDGEAMGVHAFEVSR